MSQPPPQPSVMEYTVRVPKNSKKKYHMMRFHTASRVDFKNWSSVKMERENNYKEFKSLDDDQPRFGAGSEFGREQRDEARRKRYGINIKKYKPDNQPWLLSVKDKPNTSINGTSTAIDKKFKGVREGGVSDNVSWYVFLQAKDGAFEAYPVEEWYNFQPINRYKSLNAEEAEKEFERRDKIMNYFSVMVQKKLRTDEEEGDPEDAGNKKSSTPAKSLLLSEMDDWMSDKESDDEGDDDDDDEEKKEQKPKKKPTGKPGKGRKRKQGGKNKKKEDGGSGTDCEEESDEYDEGAEHEYVSEDSSDPEREDDEKVGKDLTGVEEGKALKKLLDSEDEDDEEDELKKQEEEKKKKAKEEQESSGDEDKKKKKNKKDSSPDLSDSSEDEKPKLKDNKKAGAGGANGSNKDNSNADILKRKLADNPDGLQPSGKRARTDGGAQPAPVLPSDSGMFEDQIRRYLVRKPMTTTEILQKLKSKKTGHGSKQLVDIIAVMLKKINPHKQHVKGKMYLSLKTLNG